jgi:1-acyl-sn-glycerol-3-phosphate acyltransferase
VSIGYTYSEDNPVTGCRWVLLRGGYKVVAGLVCFFGGVLPFHEEINFDYTPYLGENYKAFQSTKPVSTIVSNHSCWSDVAILVFSKFSPSFASKKSIQKKPVIGPLTEALQSIFIARGASEIERQ